MTIYEVLQEAKRQWGIETVQAIKNKINEEGLIWQNNLINSIGLNQDDTLDGNITFKMIDYGKFLDEGVNGLTNNFGSQFSYRGNVKGMGAALKPWADSKGINAWAVANSLQSKGLQPRRFFNSVIESRLPDLATKIEQAYTLYLNNAINAQQRP
jgi:hypothetical protein